MLRENSTQLTDRAEHAETKGVANYMVQDAGRTQVSEMVSCWENSTQLTDLAKQSETKGVANYIVQDAG